MIFVSSIIAGDILDVEIGPRHLPDHTPVTLKWKLEQGKSREWHWHLNNLLLETPKVAEKIKTEIKHFFPLE